MFIGHWAPALAAAAVSRRAPKLGMAFLAAQLVDWAFFALAIFGIENMGIEPGITAMNPMDLYDLPYTHSLAGTAAFAAGFGILLWIGRSDPVTGLWGAGIVLSHWVLDLVTHRPDLTLVGSAAEGARTFGLGLLNHPWIAMPLEIGIVLAAFFFYLSKTRGPVAPPLILLFLLLAMQAINWFGPEPPEANIGLYLSALAAFALVTIVAMWVGTTRRHRLHLGMSA